MTPRGKIRPLAIGVVSRDDFVFVAEGRDPVKAEIFYRPPGGGIEFGEHGQQALAREFREELGVEITCVRYLGAIENIFTYNGKDMHEIVLLYATKFVDPQFYEKETVDGREDNGQPFKAVWKSLADFQSGKAILYPTGLLEMLLQHKE